MSSTHRKEINAIVTALRRQGFQVEKANNGHFKAISPEGRTCQFASTPSHSTSVKNTVTRLKRIGYEPVKK